MDGRLTPKVLVTGVGFIVMVVLCGGIANRFV
jgi:hypothetical protein